MKQLIAQLRLSHVYVATAIVHNKMTFMHINIEDIIIHNINLKPSRRVYRQMLKFDPVSITITTVDACGPHFVDVYSERSNVKTK